MKKQLVLLAIFLLSGIWSFAQTGGSNEILIQGSKIQYTGTPVITEANDVTSKSYVDALVSPGESKAECIAATTGAITLSGEQTIDGHACITGDRLLVRNQPDSKYNGVYAVSTGAWDRVTDMDTWAELKHSSVFIHYGADNGSSIYTSSIADAGTLGVDPIVWNKTGQMPDMTGYSINNFYTARGKVFIQQGTNIDSTTVIYAPGDLTENVTGLEFSGLGKVVSGDLGLNITSGYVIPTSTELSNATSGYNDKINSLAVSGTTTKTLTLSQQDGGTVSNTFTDLVNDADADPTNEIQNLSYTASTRVLAIDGSGSTDVTFPLAGADPGLMSSADKTKLDGITEGIGFPPAGIVRSDGSIWGTSISDNSGNWNIAYSDRLKWDGGSTGLNATTARTSLELVIGTNVLAPNGSAASLTNFPILNQSTTGNAATATKLASSRTINGVAFNGTTNITVPSNIAPGLSGNIMTSNGTIWTSTTPAPGVTSATGTAPLTLNFSAGALTGSISTATPSAAGSLSSTDKTKLDGIQTAAEVNIQADWSTTNTAYDSYILNKPDLTIYKQKNDSVNSTGYASQYDLTSYYTKTEVNNTLPLDSIWTVRDKIFISFGHGTKIDSTGNETNVPQLGDFYQGGYVFYVDPSNSWGLCASTSYVNTVAVPWSLTNTNISTSTSVGTGQTNTTAIIANQGSGSYGAQLCNDLSLTGYTDWYLPSKDELYLIYTVLKVSKGINYPSITYLSSSQNGTSTTLNWVLWDMAGSGMTNETKTSAKNVIAVRTWYLGSDQTVPTGANGDILYSNGGSWTPLPIGTTGQVLKVTSGYPAWGAVTGTGTVTSVATGTGLTGGTITSTGTISLASGVCTPGTYRSVTFDTYGRATGGTNPTTLAGYGLTNVAQPYYANLSSIGSLSNGAGYLYNNGSGTFSYATPTGGSGISVAEVDGSPSLGSITNLQFSGATVSSNGTNVALVTIPVGNITSATGTAPLTLNFATGALTGSVSAATTGASGLMSGPDKLKLDGIATGATANTGTVTGVTGTAPIVSSGGNAPVISISEATTSVAGSMPASDKTKLDGFRSLTPQSITTSANCATYCNFYTTASSAKTITFSNTFEGLSGQVEITYSGAAVITFAHATYTIKIADNIYNGTTGQIITKSSGTAIYSFYVRNSIIYINGTQTYN